jgi:flagellar biosynthesis/type III secretory pathway M-ring protein FliF/YscJ
MNVQEIVSAVGEMSKEDLVIVDQALKAAHKYERERRLVSARANLRLKDKVETEGLSPKRINGIVGTIARFGKGGTRADIKVEEPGIQWQYEKGDIIHGVPIQCLIKQ